MSKRLILLLLFVAVAAAGCGFSDIRTSEDAVQYHFPHDGAFPVRAYPNSEHMPEQPLTIHARSEFSGFQVGEMLKRAAAFVEHEWGSFHWTEEKHLTPF